VIICDATQFYCEVGGGVGRYLREKRAYVRDHTEDEHILLVPGARDDCIRDGRLTLCTVRSRRLTPTSRYRALLNVKRAQEYLLDFKPDIIESGDPYHLGWQLIHAGQLLGIPVAGFYHSHFPEAHLRTVMKYCGPWVRDVVMAYAEDYIRRLYNDFDATFVPSAFLRDLLETWGVENARTLHLGVNVETFSPAPSGLCPADLHLPDGRQRLLYVGRLASEKNIRVLLQTFEELDRRSPGRYAFLIIGDGTYRDHVKRLQERLDCLYWESYCEDSSRLADFYRLADCFVHPGVFETFGLVALESQASGCPVVGIRGTYMDANIFAGLEYWADQNSVPALADAVERVLASDPAALGARAGQCVRERFSWKTVFSRQWEMYHSIIQRKARLRRHGRLYR
jgi:alpha-1,6-mannosyltransferase